MRIQGKWMGMRPLVGIYGTVTKRIPLTIGWSRYISSGNHNSHAVTILWRGIRKGEGLLEISADVVERWRL